jgi:transposase
MNNQTTTTTTQHTQTLIAIDVAKDSLEVQTDESAFSLENSPKGFKALLRKVPQKTGLLVVFEATGGYERALAEFLHERKIALSIINPRLLRSFARSEGIKAKTDPIDAKMIYRFARSKALRITPAPTAGQRELSDLLDRRSQLSEFLAREQNRIQKTLPKALLASLRRNMKALEKEMALIEKHIRALVDSTPDLKKHCLIITSVKGVGEITAWTLLAQLPEITTLSRNQLVALAGVAPYNNDSGKFSGKRSIYGGRAKIRRVLFMAARAAAQFNPVIRAYVGGLLARGKPYKCALTAAMRKILIHVQSLLKKCEICPC